MSANDDNTPPPPPSQSQEQQWGRVLICGGTDWTKLGRKERGGAVKEVTEPTNPDLLEPHILRSLSNVKVTGIYTSCCGCHFIVLDVDGVAWLFGRNGSSALGVSNVDAISENAPRKLKASDLGAPAGTKFVHAACGRNHSLLVDSEGHLWTAGVNNLGQCGHPVCPEISTFKVVHGPWHGSEDERVVKAAAGITFSVVLTESGKVFSFGSGEKGQLGHGRTGERIVTGNKIAYDVEPQPIPVRGIDDKKIVQISCGQQHTIAIDDTGVVYVWGYNGYCRLGLGNQVDILAPKIVPQFAGPNEVTMGALAVAGPSNSVVVDKQGMYWMAGKWKNSGDGSSGSPYSSFRYMQDIMACKISVASCGGVTHWAVTPDDDGSPMTIAWGQNAANGELGLGPDEPKSATKPTRNLPLLGIEVFDIAAGQNTTLLLTRPNEKFSDLPRHPIEVQPPALCVVCSKDTGDEDSPLQCDKCDSPYHLGCLEPALDSVPDGEWFCPDCETHPGGPVGALALKKSKSKSKAKAKSEDSDDASKVTTGSKRKVPPKAKNTAPKKKKI